MELLHVCSETRLKLRGSDSESAVKMRAGVRIHLLAVKEWKPDSHQQVRSGVRGNSSASPLFRIEKKLAASCPGGATSSILQPGDNLRSSPDLNPPKLSNLMIASNEETQQTPDLDPGLE